MTSPTHISGAINRLSWFGSRLRRLEAFESVTLPFTAEHSHTSTEPVLYEENSANFLMKKVKNEDTDCRGDASEETFIV